MGRKLKQEPKAGSNAVLTSEEFQKLHGKKKSLRKKSNQQINREMTQSFLAQCEAAGFPKPLCEYKFHPKRKWRIDFVMLTTENGILGIEIEGRGHNREAMYRKDLTKYNEATFSGIKLLRFTVKEVFDGTAIREIRRIL